MRACLISLVFVFLLISTHASADLVTKLAAGEVVIKTTDATDTRPQKVKAVGVIKAPMEKIWPLIDQCAQYPKTMLRIHKAKEISRKNNRVRCQITVELPFPLSNLTCTTDAIHTVKPGVLYKRAWTLVKGDYKTNSGSWTLAPFQDSLTETLVVYETNAEPNIALPDWIRKSAQEKTLPDLFMHLRKQAK